MRELACERCGRGFGCGIGDGACWCAELTHTAPLPAGDGDCLCPGCLGERVEPAPEAAGALHVRTQRADSPRERRV
jgi:hypothetical protein